MMKEVEGLPVGWSVTNVAQLASIVRPGFPSGIHNDDGRGLPHLRPMNIDGQGRLSLAELKYVEVVNPPLLQDGDILFNNTNSPVWVGKTTVIKQSDVYTYSNHMTRITTNCDVGIPSFFAYQLHYLQQSGYFLARCTNHVNQAKHLTISSARFLWENHA